MVPSAEHPTTGGPCELRLWVEAV